MPKPLNYTSTGYFAKALSGILSKKPNEVKLFFNKKIK